MKLQLRYSEVGKQDTAAAFIKGADIQTWLNALSIPGVFLEQLLCFCVPASVHTNTPAGLFVIFSTGKQPGTSLLLEPCKKVGNKLFIPAGTMLYPAVASDELDSLLAFDYQFMHPATGMVGFDRQDAINLADFISIPAATSTDWSFANPGLDQKPALTQIIVQQPAMEEIMQTFKNDIDTKPLEEIPGKATPGPLEKAVDAVKLTFFKALMGLMGTGSSGGRPRMGGDNGGGGGGFFGKVINWIVQNLAELEKKREAELNRLMQLFENNDDEALQYAIPLDSPYLNRGNAPKSGSLSRRNTDFNLRNLGGGRATDGWDIGDRYHDLRAKYLKAAQQKLDQKDYRKAAYIYAHLLGDYRGAASALEQGNFFREAAAIHKDHFKNTAAAAECLERGGLYFEAIPLFDQLNRYEKVGDLYTLLQNQENADAYFKKTIDVKLSSNDHLDAARIADKKMHNPAAAKDILLTGWMGHTQAEQCLDKYFDIVHETEERTTEEKVEDIYRQHTPVQKRPLFLNVLQRVHDKAGGNNHRYQDIAYEIISDEATRGNTRLLHNLKQFIRHDALLGNDCSRYTNNDKQAKLPAKPDGLQLDPHIKWVTAVAHRNQLIAVGQQNKIIHMARANWYGNTEYYSWPNPVKTNTRFNFTCAPLYGNQVLLQCDADLPITLKKLPKNKYFTEELVVRYPVGLHTLKGNFVINEKEELCRLEISAQNITIHYYSIQGDVKRSVNCRADKPELLYSSVMSCPYTIKWYDHFYTYHSKLVLMVTENGLARVLELDSIIRLIAASNEYALDNSFLHVVISTNKGLLLYTPEKGNNNTINEHYFAADLIPSSIVFIAQDRFIVAEKKRAVLFVITGGVAKLVQIYNSSGGAIIAVLPVSRHKFALLEENGKILNHDSDLFY